MADNWYIVLQLDFDPPIHDEEQILKKINEKSKFWVSKFQDSKLGPNYRTWHKSIPQIEKDMIGNDNIRCELAKEACDISYAKLDNTLTLIAKKGHVTKDEGDRIALKLNLNSDIVKKRAKFLNIEWVASNDSEKYEKIYKKYYKNKHEESLQYDQIKNILKTFNVDNLYDFLYINSNTKDAQNIKNISALNHQELLKMAEEKKKKEFFKNDSVSSNGSKLCAQCKIAFVSEDKKKKYDDYLKYIKSREILESVKSVADISGEISLDQVNGYIDQLKKVFKDKTVDCEEIFIAFCKLEKIPYTYTAPPPKSVKVCRCGVTNDISDGRRVCKACGLDLEIKCPKCGAINDANIKVCKCKFDFENIDRALASCNAAERAINMFDFSSAKMYIGDSEKYWPNNSEAAGLKAKLADIENKVGNKVSKMNKLMKDKKYFNARIEYENIKNLFSGYSDIAIESKIDEAINTAESLFEKLKKTNDEKNIIQLCSQIYDLCSDFKGIKKFIPETPAVKNMSVNASSNEKINLITWSALNDKSIRYVLVRSENNWISNVSDGEVIFKGSANSYSDKDIVAGVTYYYNVFAERIGVYSSGLEGKSVVNLFDISNVSIIIADASLNIKWDAMPENATAEIYEVLSKNKENLIETTKATNYFIDGLINENTYTYRIVLSYTINGKKQSTEGCVISGMPDSPPEPIDSLRINALEDNKFEAFWYQDSPKEVRFFYSTEKPAYNKGETVPLKVLEQKMRILKHLPLSSTEKLKTNEKGISFRHDTKELIYIVPVVIKSLNAIFGAVSIVSVGEELNINLIKEVNNKINIYLDTPDSAVGFIILYRFDKFPEGIQDVKAIRKYNSIKQYNLNNALVIDDVEPKNYYFSVFAEFNNNGEKNYSFGSNYLFENVSKLNITYSISVSKKMFKDNILILEFESNEKEFLLPAIDVMSSIGNAPVFKKSSKMIHSINEQQVKGSLRIKIPFPKDILKDTHIKPFFKEEQTSNQLLIKLGSKSKVN